MQLNLSFPPSFPSNVAWHPPLIRKARTRCDLTGFHLSSRSDQVLSLGRLACWRSSRPGAHGLSNRIHTLSLSRAPRLCPAAVDITMLTRYESRSRNAHGQHSWTPLHHWLKHQDYQIQRRIRQRWETKRHRGTADLQCGQPSPTANLKRSSVPDLRYCTRALRSFIRNALKWSFTSMLSL